jgi:HPt (histidine-containing phosphotransfer) domain-containing protein
MEYKFINIEYLDSVSGGDLGITKEIVEMFREQVVEIYEEMRSLYDEKKYASLGLLAHKAKSSVAIMGMDDLATMLKTFELQAKEGQNPGEYLSYIERFRVETAEAVAELDDLIKKRSNNSDGQY